MTSTMRPAQFAATAINTVDQNGRQICQNPDGTPRNLTAEQATAANQVMALNAIAAGLLAIADAITNAKAPGHN